MTFDDPGRRLSNGVFEFPRAVMAVYPHTQRITLLEIAIHCRSDAITRIRQLYWVSLHRDQWFTDIETELGVQTHRSVVIGDLHQPHPGRVLCSASLEHFPHQRGANAAVLHDGSHGQRTDTEDR
ncbi:hypothetical protein A5624_10545 [Mycobacterium sp. 1482292.6]|nr:hypothetical protein A5624_10545 [Mycobacterium sp. 1482292.6]OBJ24482.1 hypothetical protein A5622_11775 [Mycobacterium sp. 1245801.1]